MGLYIGLGFPGDLMGDFLDGDDGFDEEASRVCALGGFGPTWTPFGTFNSVPLLGRFGGGEDDPSSLSDETTIGFLRAAARGGAIPP